MQIIEFTNDSLRFLDAVPAKPAADGFVWIFLEQHEFAEEQAQLQQAASNLGGSALLELHCQDLASTVHPSHYDSTSIYDLVIFRRLATQTESLAETPKGAVAIGSDKAPAFHRISSKAVGFVVFDRCLVSVHPPGCYTAKSFVQRFLADAKFSLDVSSPDPTAARSRLPTSPADLALRMINSMVDSYLDLRRVLSSQLEQWQADLLRANSRFDNWGTLMTARTQLHVLEDLCDEQHDAMQEWLDSLREQPLVLPPQVAGGLEDVANSAHGRAIAQHHRDQLIARARDVMEHIARVLQHARRLEQSAETVVQIHFNAQSSRTNNVMRTLTAVTAIFLPLNLITGFFGMNFEHIPGLKSPTAFWVTLGVMVLVVVVVLTIFLRKRYIARTGR